jgi:anhydro-N-acetylmuramic acid kinase
MNKYHVVGLMSGTSLDGVDIALCTFEKRGSTWKFSIEAAETISYSHSQAKVLSGLMQVDAMTFARQNTAYGKFLGELVRSFVKAKRFKADFISSHGHTIFHQPSKGFTTQIGDGAALSVASGLPVVCDFRTADVALGGQGAPLVPIGDKLIFSEYDFCLNLGGIANISFEGSGKRIAFDICPVNLVLNFLSSEKGKRYDEGGKMACSGKVLPVLLKKLNAVSFYKRKFPKSLGREEIEKDFFRMIKSFPGSVQDKLNTFCEHIALQISAATENKKGKMLVTGGGAYNDFLMNRIKHHSKLQIVIPSGTIIEFKEALIFALLGVLRWRNEVNCLSSVTGASRDSSGGAIYLP